MKTFLAVLLFCCAASAQIQHADLPHALTVEQCRADAVAWWATALGHDIPYQTLDAEDDEMSACTIHIDLNNTDDDRLYTATKLVIATEQHYRMAMFLKHHHMLDQFKQEDAAGVR